MIDDYELVPKKKVVVSAADQALKGLGLWKQT